MQLGIFAKTFPAPVPPPAGRGARGRLRVHQFNMAGVDLPPMPDAIPDAVLADLGAAAAASGVAIVALSGTYNMIHPDPTVRADGLRRLGVMLAAARRLGVGLVTLCTGSRDALDQWRHHPDNATPAAWADLCREMAQAVRDGRGRRRRSRHRAGAGQRRDFRGRRDAADRRDGLGAGAHRARSGQPVRARDRAEARAVVAEAIDLLGDRIAMAHGKDRAADGSFTTVGKGVVDFPDFIARLGAAGFAGPIVTHGLTAEEAPGVASYLRGLITR